MFKRIAMILSLSLFHVSLLSKLFYFFAKKQTNKTNKNKKTKPKTCPNISVAKKCSIKPTHLKEYRFPQCNALDFLTFRDE